MISLSNLLDSLNYWSKIASFYIWEAFSSAIDTKQMLEFKKNQHPYTGFFTNGKFEEKVPDQLSTKVSFYELFYKQHLRPALIRVLYSNWQCLKRTGFCWQVGTLRNKPCIMYWDAYEESRLTAHLAVSQSDGFCGNSFKPWIKSEFTEECIWS